jgi:hypothetical protein
MLFLSKRQSKEGFTAVAAYTEFPTEDIFMSKSFPPMGWEVEKAKI